MRIPREYHNIFKEYIAIRILDKITEDEFDKFKPILDKTTDINSLYKDIAIFFPNLQDEINAFESDFLTEIQNGK